MIPEKLLQRKAPTGRANSFIEKKKKLKKSLGVGASWAGSITAKWSAVPGEPGQGTGHEFKNDMVHGNNWQAIWGGLN